MIAKAMKSLFSFILVSVYVLQRYEKDDSFHIFAARMKKVLIICLLLISTLSHAEKWQVDWYGSARMAGTTGQYMPFWARTGGDGILPVTSSGIVSAGTDLFYKANKGFSFGAGLNLVGALAQISPVNTSSVYGIIDRMYFSGNWKMLHLDAGFKPWERTLSDISVTGGNIIFSRNARNIPGVNVWSDWIYFEKGHWVGFKGNISHYQTVDNRFVKGAMIHNKALHMKVALGRNVDLSVGFEHWAKWGGDSPLYGEQPLSFKDYIRIFMAGKGGEDATLSDRVNVLGNHLGRECIRFDWRHSDFTMTLQYDKPFEDGSGMRFKNAPDGVWSMQILFKDREALVTDFVFEYIKTSWQSGPYHDRPATEEEMLEQDPNSHYYGKKVLGGCDTYFNNGEYKSGWTYHNRIIGLPLILPAAPGEDGITMDVIGTRVFGCHLGLKGFVDRKIPYMFKITCTSNLGNYNQLGDSPFITEPWQLSLALEAGLGSKVWKLPIELTLGVYGDIGQLYQDSVGLTLKIDYKGFARF